jgi:hypothetical protein
MSDDVSRGTSAVREAIKAVVDRWAETDAEPDVRDRGGMDPLGNDASGFIADLVDAVERVPVTVTIRDLDMDPENIVTVRDIDRLQYVRDLVGHAAEEGALHLAVDEGYLKIKAGSGTWSAPIETEVYEG